MWDRWANFSSVWIMWGSLYCQVSKSGYHVGQAVLPGGTGVQTVMPGIMRGSSKDTHPIGW